MSTVWDRIKLWASASDEDKIQFDRRAFLTGMAVTSSLCPAGPCSTWVGCWVVAPVVTSRTGDRHKRVGAFILKELSHLSACQVHTDLHPR